MGAVRRVLRVGRAASRAARPLPEAKRSLLNATTSAQRDCLALTVLATPLAMMAVAAIGAWWMWPVSMACAYGWSRSRRWEWVLAFEEAVVGSMWMWIGVSALRTFPTSLPLVGACWAAFPAALAVVGWWTHRRFGD